jgi:polyisoprenoid-binding protein YceI
MNTFAGRAILALSLALLASCGQRAAPDVAATTAESQASAATHTAPGEWRLIAAESSISFVSIKNNAVAEVHQFTGLSGRLGPEGRVDLQVSLASVATGVEIRDQRLREMLFEVAKFPHADVSLDVDAAQIAALPVGGHAVLKTSFTLSLHGVSTALPAQMRITRTSETAWLVVSERPTIVPATSFELINGVDELRKVAGLQAIASAVPVSFMLTFTRSQN